MGLRVWGLGFWAAGRGFRALSDWPNSGVVGRTSSRCQAPTPRHMEFFFVSLSASVVSKEAMGLHGTMKYTILDAYTLRFTSRLCAILRNKTPDHLQSQCLNPKRSLDIRMVGCWLKRSGSGFIVACHPESHHLYLYSRSKWELQRTGLQLVS